MAPTISLFIPKALFSLQHYLFKSRNLAEILLACSLTYQPKIFNFSIWKDVLPLLRARTPQSALQIPIPTLLIWLTPCYHLFLFFFFNWRIIALQNFAVFCQTSTWISHRYIYISHPFWPSLPSPSPSHSHLFLTLTALHGETSPPILLLK